jgi:aspartate carbamoyltransferase catalytic subunit
LDPKTILSIIERASFFSQLLKSKQKIPKTLENKIIANLFFEHSTRTRFSFEVAAKRLGAEVLNFDAKSSSIAKGETLYDTLKTFEALGIDIGVIRHSDDSYIESLKNTHGFNIINAGAGKFEHPSQSLLDLQTIYEEFGTLENLTICICGDISNSRVASSNIRALKKFNSNVILCGPPALLPDTDKLDEHCQISTLDEAIEVADVVMMLRVQHERHHLFELDINEYNQNFGLNLERVKKMKEKSIIMHPGPFNRDIEISSEIVEHHKSRIFKQKENGVYTRMAILEWIVA